MSAESRAIMKDMQSDMQLIADLKQQIADLKHVLERDLNHFMFIQKHANETSTWLECHGAIKILRKILGKEIK